MQSLCQKFETQMTPAIYSGQRGLLPKSTTYLAKIAVILQDAPNKMLTFPELMNMLAQLMCEDRKSVENNIRVCLSTNKCFVKVPLVPGSLCSKRNYWKLDLDQITEKMVRRHFKGILELFPELASKLGTRSSAAFSPEPAAVPIKGHVKFDSPFSIESILERDDTSAQVSSAFPHSVPAQMEQPSFTQVMMKRGYSLDSEELLFQFSDGGSPFYSSGVSTPPRPIKRMFTEASSPFCSTFGAAPYFTSSYRGYYVPTVTYDAPRLFW